MRDTVDDWTKEEEAVADQSTHNIFNPEVYSPVVYMYNSLSLSLSSLPPSLPPYHGDI